MTDRIGTNGIKNNLGFSIIISKEKGKKKKNTQVSSIRDQENEKLRIIIFS